MDNSKYVLVDMVRYLKLGGEKKIFAFINSRLPSMLNSMAEILPELRLMEEKRNDRDKVQHLLRYIFSQIHTVTRNLKETATK